MRISGLWNTGNFLATCGTEYAGEGDGGALGLLVLQVGVDVDGGGVVTVAYDAHGDLGGDAGGDAAGDVVMAEGVGGDVGIVVIGEIGGFAGFACFQGGGTAGLVAGAEVQETGGVHQVRPAGTEFIGGEGSALVGDEQGLRQAAQGEQDLCQVVGDGYPAVAGGGFGGAQGGDAAFAGIEIHRALDVHHAGVPVEIAPLQAQHFPTAAAQVIEQVDHQAVRGGSGGAKKALLLLGGEGGFGLGGGGLGEHQRGGDVHVQQVFREGIANGMHQHGAGEGTDDAGHARAGVQAALEIGPAHGPEQLLGREIGQNVGIDDISVVLQGAAGADARALDDLEPFHYQGLEGNVAGFEAVPVVSEDILLFFVQLPKGTGADIYGLFTGGGRYLGTVTAVFLFLGHGGTSICKR